MRIHTNGIRISSYREWEESNRKESGPLANGFGGSKTGVVSSQIKSVFFGAVKFRVVKLLDSCGHWKYFRSEFLVIAWITYTKPHLGRWHAMNYLHGNAINRSYHRENQRHFPPPPNSTFVPNDTLNQTASHHFPHCHFIQYQCRSDSMIPNDCFCLINYKRCRVFFSSVSHCTTTKQGLHHVC